MLYQILPNDVPKYWDLVRETLARSPSDRSMEEHFHRAREGVSHLLVWDEGRGVAGVAVVDVFDTKAGKVAFVDAIAGRWIIKQQAFDHLKAWAKNWGCSRIRGAVPDGLMRKYKEFGFEKTLTVVECEI